MSRGRGKKKNPQPTQKHLAFEPDYIVESGVKFQFNGTLLIPAPGEVERLAAIPKPPQPIETKQIITATMGVHTLPRPEPPTHNGIVTHGTIRRVKIEAKDLMRMHVVERG